MRELLTDALDTLGLLGVAAGVGTGSAAAGLGWWGLAVAGAVVLAGSRLATRVAAADARRAGGQQ